MNRKEFLNIKDIDIFYRKENPEPQAILHATFNYNTTRLTLTDLTGNTIIWLTPSRCGFKGTVRRTVFASIAAVNEMARQSIKLVRQKYDVSKVNQNIIEIIEFKK